jgi:hypothetical protein
MPILHTFDENNNDQELVNLIMDKEVHTKKEFMSRDDYRQILSSWRNSNQLCEEEYRQKLKDTLGPGSGTRAYVNETKKYFAQYNEIASALTDKIKTNLVKKMNSVSHLQTHSQRVPLNHKKTQVLQDEAKNLIETHGLNMEHLGKLVGSSVDRKEAPPGEDYDNRFTSINAVNKYRVKTVGDRLNYGVIESEGSVSEEFERQFKGKSQLLNSIGKKQAKSMKKFDQPRLEKGKLKNRAGSKDTLGSLPKLKGDLGVMSRNRVKGN